jgi:ribosomal protein S18 acetylase RimI-like enzyme
MSVNKDRIGLRPVLPGDEEFLYHLFATTRRAELEPFGWFEQQIETLLRMQFRAQAMSFAASWPAAEHDIVIADQASVGRLYVGETGGELSLIDITILPEQRSRGIGSLLLGRLMERCRASGKPLTLHVATANPRARALYERHGFQSQGGDVMYEAMIWRPR